MWGGGGQWWKMTTLSCIIYGKLDEGKVDPSIEYM